MRMLRRIERLLRDRTLETSAGATRVSIPLPGQFRSFYVFALHKSGSTLLNAMLAQGLDHAKVPHVALSELAFAAGLPENEITNPETFIFSHGYCYRGFREFPPYLRAFDISKNKKILLIRDPRDMLVSDYFSTAYSHSVPQRGPVHDLLTGLRNFAKSVDVNKYCLSQVAVYKAEFESYRHLLESDTRVYRYEDVIFDKRKWLEDILSYFQVAVPKNVIESIVFAHDVRPEREDPSAHIRQVIPGNFRRHLEPATIDILNREFDTELIRHSYQRC
jgi:hypothetical protein